MSKFKYSLSITEHDKEGYYVSHHKTDITVIASAENEAAGKALEALKPKSGWYLTVEVKGVEEIEPQKAQTMPEPTQPKSTLADASRLLAEQAVKIEDSAVSEYIRLQAEHLKAMGKNLADYYLVRENGNLTYDKGNTFKQGVYYGLKHKDEVMKVEFPDD